MFTPWLLLTSLRLRVKTGSSRRHHTTQAFDLCDNDWEIPVILLLSNNPFSFFPVPFARCVGLCRLSNTLTLRTALQKNSKRWFKISGEKIYSTHIVCAVFDFLKTAAKEQRLWTTTSGSLKGRGPFLFSPYFLHNMKILFSSSSTRSQNYFLKESAQFLFHEPNKPKMGSLTKYPSRIFIYSDCFPGTRVQ